MIEKELNKYLINNVDIHTENVMNLIQDTLIPTNYDLNYSRRSGYFYKGYYKYQAFNNRAVYLVKNMPVTTKIRNSYKGPLTELIHQNEMKPFLLFINNRFIKWSDIEVIIDSKNSYLYLNNLDYSELEGELHCILIPPTCIYKETSNTAGFFTFSSEGNFIQNIDKDCTSISFNNKSTDFYFEKIRTTSNTIINSGLYIDYPLSENNIFIFIDGKLSLNNNIKFIGCNWFEVVMEEDKEIDCVVLYNYYIKGKDIISKFPNTNYALEYLKNNNNEATQIMKERFKMNSTDSLENAMQYDSTLLDDYYINNMDYKEEVISGREFKLRRYSDTAYVYLHRKGLSSNVMIFKNRKLYEYNKWIKVESDKILVPLVDINDDDIIDIIYFINVNNKIIKTTFSSSEEKYEYHLNNEIPVEDVKMFSETSEYESFNIGGTGVQYEIETYSENNNTISPKDHYYFDKPITLVSNKRFDKCSFKIEDEVTHSYVLPEVFKFCNNISRYMIFVNGLMIDKTHTMITLSSLTRAFNDITIYFDFELKKGDQIDIFYLPIDLYKIDTIDHVSNHGFIQVPIKNIKYNLSKELHFVFIDGKKVSSQDLSNIKANTLKLTQDIKSMDNVVVYKAYKDQPEIESLFERIDSRYNQLTNILDDETLDNLFTLGEGNKLSNTETTEYTPVSKKSIYYEIIKKYYLLPSIYKDNGEEIFNYDFANDDMLDVGFFINDKVTLFTYVDGNLEDKFVKESE